MGKLILIAAGCLALSGCTLRWRGQDTVGVRPDGAVWYVYPVPDGAK